MKNAVSEVEMQKISKLRFTGKNNTLKRRAMIVYAKLNSDLNNKDIAIMVGVSADNVSDTIKGFNNHRMEYLENCNYRGTRSILDEYKDIIISNFETDPPKNIDEAIIRIKDLTGVIRTATPLRNWLKKTDLNLSNPELFPARRIKKGKDCFWIHSSSHC